MFKHLLSLKKLPCKQHLQFGGPACFWSKKKGGLTQAQLAQVADKLLQRFSQSYIEANGKAHNQVLFYSYEKPLK